MTQQTGQQNTKSTMELLAPAGGMPQFVTALQSGADAVYVGLDELNARRGADNFKPAQLRQAVAMAHEKGSRVFLTLNILLNCREIGRAARSLELASQCGVDAVLVTDPALLLFAPHYPKLEFHFSTQTAISSSAGVKAAHELGVKRVVLAREMSREEIAVASTVADVQTEVFVQGALCMCVSGRCLLSSWGGGRSGNRGACTSPCRVDWRIAGTEKRVVLSMRDLCLGAHLDELAGAGVSCLKIEGRLKNADWVGRAVELYRKAIDTGSFNQAVADALGDYTGRQMTDGYFVNSRGKMLGVSGREAAEDEVAPVAAGAGKRRSDIVTGDYSLQINEVDGKAECTLECEGEKAVWHLPLSRVRHEKRALSLDQVGEWLEQIKVHGRYLSGFSSDSPDLLVPKNFANKVLDKLGAELRIINKPTGEENINSITLPEVVRELTNPPEFSAVNERRLGNKVNLLRLFYADALDLLEEAHPELAIVVGADVEEATEITGKYPAQKFAFSLPEVIYEKDLEGLSALCCFCAQNTIPVEVHGWDGWWLAHQAGCEMLAGAGMAVLNAHAALALSGLGFCAASYSIEAGQRQLEDLCKSMPMAGVLWVYSRPVLACTRCEMPDEVADGTVIEDSRGIRLVLRRENGLVQMYPQTPFDITSMSNDKICARWIGADLCGSPEAKTDWQQLRRRSKNPELFNYTRGLY